MSELPGANPAHCNGRVMIGAIALALWTGPTLSAGCSDESAPGIPLDVMAAEVASDVPCDGPTCSPCVASADGVPCDDLDPCTGGDACVSGACIGQSLGCTCNADADCAAQDDGDLCNGVLFCDLVAPPFTCKPKPDSAINCGSGSACIDLICAPATGTCEDAPKPAGTGCDDGNSCTNSECDGSGSCKVMASTCECETDADCAAHEDGDTCNGTLHCDAGSHTCEVFAETVVHCPAAAEPCRDVKCIGKSGQCVTSVAADGSLCEDDDVCTSGETCQGGGCAPSTLACACTDDAACALEDDGDLCNGVPFCNLATGKCQTNPASVITCPTVDNTFCRKKACLSASGTCGWQDMAAGTSCDDGNICTKGESCKSGVCTGGQQGCGCKTNADCATKEDGNLCNGTLYCDATSHACEINPATVVKCPQDPDAPCKITVCQTDSGTCAVKLAAEATPCDDGQPCTEGDACKGGVCQAGPSLQT